VTTFHVVSGGTVKCVIDQNRQRVFDEVEVAYRLHAGGDAINPDSYFLRYPDKPSARIIALPRISAVRSKRAASNGYRAFRRTGQAIWLAHRRS
jgi:hypothetical protein